MTIRKCNFLNAEGAKLIAENLEKLKNLTSF